MFGLLHRAILRAVDNGQVFNPIKSFLRWTKNLFNLVSIIVVNSLC